MVTIPLKTRLKPDGTLNLEIATGLPESDVDVVVTVQPVSSEPAAWPAGFFPETYGAFSDSPLERPPQPEMDQRESFR